VVKLNLKCRVICNRFNVSLPSFSSQIPFTNAVSLTKQTINPINVGLLEFCPASGAPIFMASFSTMQLCALWDIRFLLRCLSCVSETSVSPLGQIFYRFYALSWGILCSKWLAGVQASLRRYIDIEYLAQRIKRFGAYHLEAPNWALGLYSVCSRYLPSGALWLVFRDTKYNNNGAGAAGAEEITYICLISKMTTLWKIFIAIFRHHIIVSIENFNRVFQ